MIAQGPHSATEPTRQDVVWLVRYGAIPEVARFHTALGDALSRGVEVVIQSPRGLEIGELLQRIPTPAPAADEADEAATEHLTIERIATPEDQAAAAGLKADCQAQFAVWQERFQNWKLQLELLDLEWTLDRGKLVFYVLSGRGPETTRLALLAATVGCASIEVQPVSAEGLVPLPAAGGSCGCGSGGGGCH